MKENMLKNYTSKIPMILFLLGILLFLGGIYYLLDSMDKNKIEPFVPKNVALKLAKRKSK
jgi:hypothetical protein